MNEKLEIRHPKFREEARSKLRTFAEPDFVTPNDLKTMGKDYVVLDDAPGMWCALVCSKFSDGASYAALVEICTTRCYQLDVVAPVGMFNDSLFHCKLSDGALFLYDCLVLNGKPLSALCFQERYKRMTKLVAQGDEQAAEALAEQGRFVCLTVPTFCRRCAPLNYLHSLFSKQQQPKMLLFMPTVAGKRWMTFTATHRIHVVYEKGVFSDSAGTSLCDAFKSFKFKFLLNNNVFNPDERFVLAMCVAAFKQDCFTLGFEKVIEQEEAHDAPAIARVLLNAKQNISLTDVLACIKQ